MTGSRVHIDDMAPEDVVQAVVLRSPHMIAAGQVHGDIAQGIGQALLEQGVYDSGTG